ncbi:MAG: hypothetical protein ABIA63_08305 [bacterium]
MKKYVIVLALLGTGFIGLSQNLANQQGLAVLEMINIEKAGKTAKGDKIVLSFIFQGQPGTYYSDINLDAHKLVLEFYDTKFGDQVPEPIIAGPFTGSVIEEDEVDLNKDLEGMEPDIKKLIRVSLFFEKEIDYEISDDFNVISLEIFYGLTAEGKEVKTKKGGKKPIGIIAATVGGIIGAAAVAAYFLMPEPPPPEKPKDLVPIGLPPGRDSLLLN